MIEVSVAQHLRAMEHLKALHVQDSAFYDVMFSPDKPEDWK
jgi:hypothetical protein